MAELFITADDFGNISVKFVNDDGLPHRRVLAPGSVVDGVWIATDLSAEPEEVRLSAAIAWTADVIAAARARAEAAYVPFAPPVLTRLYKTTLWRRCTDAEFQAIRAVLALQDERAQAIWNDANYIDSRDETYSQISGAAVALFGAARAAELLAPTE